MNMFKKGRKAKDQDDGFAAPEPIPINKSSRGLTFKKKKQEVEEKPAFDLGSALPDTNEFRTSLLMTGLSARFSMLREQDDPNSKLGKASDDSVLFPKRASGFDLFSNSSRQQLADIAEVESIHSSFRPPFADERKNSISEGYQSDDTGSIMNRTRPGEGNNLFGGRQKLYKITTGSTRSLAPETGGMTSGKHTYESDYPLSAFQQIRLKEKEDRARRELEEHGDFRSFAHADSGEHDSASPLTAFSKNRGTQSSTNSGPSHRPTSTAATSITSDSPVMQQGYNTAIEKVKDFDANSSAESIGFASSPSLRKLREENGRVAPRLSQSRSAANMRDNYSRHSPVPQSFRAMSPPLSISPNPMEAGLRESNRSQASSRFQTTSPTFPVDMEQDSTLAHNVRPNDRGKATALGLFNKPNQHYDDAQFQQRQMQMHEGRMSPMLNSLRSVNRASPEPAQSQSQPQSTRTSQTSLQGKPAHDRETPQLPPIPDQPASPVQQRRTSASSGRRPSGGRSRAKSAASNHQVSVKARVESLIRRQNAELAALEANHLGERKSSEDDQPNGTFFNNSDDSDDESSAPKTSTKDILSTAPQPPPPSDVHPALRNGGASEKLDFQFPQQTEVPRTSTYSVASSRPRKSFTSTRRSGYEPIAFPDDVDSPTLPNSNGLGLSGMVRSHLRQESNASSVYPPESPVLSPEPDTRISLGSLTHTYTNSESVKSDPFEYDREREHDRQQLLAPAPAQAPAPTIEAQPPTPTMAMSLRAQEMMARAKEMRDAAEAQRAPSATNKGNYDQAPAPQSPVKPQQSSPGHKRSESTETEREMERFDQTLEARRRKIEEGLKSVQERSRSRSPIGPKGAFSLPKFAGRSNTGDRPEPNAKSMKILGLPHGQKELGSSPRFPEPEDRSRSTSRTDNSSRQGQRQYRGEEGRVNGRSTPTDRAQHDRSQPRSTPPSSRNGDSRSRSTSGATERVNKFFPDFNPPAMPASPFMAMRSESPGAYDRSTSSAASQRGGPMSLNRPLVPPGPADLAGLTSRSPRVSPPMESPLSGARPFSPPSDILASPPPAGRSTPNGRTSAQSNRKRSINKSMISEPTFVSSTSTMTLVHLPKDGGPSPDPIDPTAPPLPTMNPRRRNTGQDGEGTYAPHPGVRPSETMVPRTSPPRRTKLHKSSSEGGNLASKARAHAIQADLARERGPNGFGFSRSATAVDAKAPNSMF